MYIQKFSHLCVLRNSTFKLSRKKITKSVCNSARQFKYIPILCKMYALQWVAVVQRFPSNPSSARLPLLTLLPQHIALVEALRRFPVPVWQILALSLFVTLKQ